MKPAMELRPMDLYFPELSAMIISLPPIIAYFVVIPLPTATPTRCPFSVICSLKCSRYSVYIPSPFALLLTVFPHIMCRRAFILTINTLPVLNCPVNWYFFSIFQHFLWIVAKPDFYYFSHGHPFFCSFFMIGFLNACTCLVGWAAS